MTPHIIHTEGGKLAPDSSPNNVDAMVEDAVRNAGAGGIVLHFHGGLVSESSGREIADILDPIYRDQAAAVPIFLVWESHILETLQNNGPQIAKETFFRLVQGRVEQMVRRKFGQGAEGRSAGTLPPVDVRPIQLAINAALDSGLPEPADEPLSPADLSELREAERRAIELDLELDRELRTEIEAISNGLLDPTSVAAAASSRSPLGQASSRTLMDADVVLQLVEVRAPGDRGLLSTWKVIKAIVEIGARVVHRFLKRRDHGLHATIVEEILRALYFGRVGGYVWEKMKEDTSDAFRPDPNIYGGSALLRALDVAAKSGAPPKVTLVAHSAGAVYVTHFLRNAHQRLGPEWKFDVIFLAPAVTFELWHEEILGAQAAQRVREYRAFGMSDGVECHDALLKAVPFLYPHSLLYIVSGLFERKADTPLLGMERFFDAGRYSKRDFPHIEATRVFNAKQKDAAVWSVTGAPVAVGHRSAARSHSAFDTPSQDPETMKSVAHILRSGF